MIAAKWLQDLWFEIREVAEMRRALAQLEEEQVLRTLSVHVLSDPGETSTHRTQAFESHVAP